MARKQFYYSKSEIRLLRAHSKAGTPVAKIVREMQRSGPALRAKAAKMGLALGHQQR